MKKKTYKAMLNRIARETYKYQLERVKRIQAENRIDAAENKARVAVNKAKEYAERFRNFGKNVETIEDGLTGGPITMLKWDMTPEEYGDYVVISRNDTIFTRIVERELATKLAIGLIENNLVQFILLNNRHIDPLKQFKTYGAKIYVVPWEQMPHRRTIELRQLAERGMELYDEICDGEAGAERVPGDHRSEIEKREQEHGEPGSGGRVWPAVRSGTGKMPGDPEDHPED